MAVDFTKLLGKQVDTVEKPKPVPVGTYLMMIQGHEFGESGQKKTPYVRFNMSIMSAQDDVDADMLAEAGGLEKVKERKQKLDFYLTDDAMFRLREFLEITVGLNCSGRSFSETIPETTNQAINAHIAHEISQRNPGEVYANIDSYAKA